MPGHGLVESGDEAVIWSWVHKLPSRVEGHTDHLAHDLAL